MDLKALDDTYYIYDQNYQREADSHRQFPCCSFLPLIIRTEDILNGIIISNVVLPDSYPNSSTMFLICENLAFEGERLINNHNY